MVSMLCTRSIYATFVRDSLEKPESNTMNYCFSFKLLLESLLGNGKFEDFKNLRKCIDGFLRNFFSVFQKLENLFQIDLFSFTLMLIFSLADVSKNWTPNWSANCLPLSVVITLSSSMSHLLPTKITWALSHEYVLICVTQSCTELNDSSFVISYIRMKPIAPL